MSVGGGGICGYKIDSGSRPVGLMTVVDNCYQVSSTRTFASGARECLLVILMALRLYCYQCYFVFALVALGTHSARDVGISFSGTLSPG